MYTLIILCGFIHVVGHSAYLSHRNCVQLADIIQSVYTYVAYRYVVSHSTYVRTYMYRIILLVGECTALLASGSKPTTLKAATCSTENST